MNLHVIYRSTGPDAGKPRPGYFSKLLALASFLRAVEAHGAVDILFLNDGEIPRDRLALMSRAGTVGWLPQTDLARRLMYRDEVSGAGMIRSYLGALAVVENSDWDDEDIVYLVEDDYLHVPEAVSTLVDAAAALSEAAYLAPYATIDWVNTRGLAHRADGYTWHTASSATSTFAARVGALRADMWIHRLAFFGCLGPDQDICRTFQGQRPYSWSSIVGHLLGTRGNLGSSLGRSKRAAVRAGMNLLAIRAGFHSHLMVTPVPSTATHMHLPYLAPGVEWERVAADSAAWAEERESAVSSPVQG